MSYRVNVHKPTPLATIHRVNNDPRCQPREKSPEDGYWTEPVATKAEATQKAKDSGLPIHDCGVCHP